MSQLTAQPLRLGETLLVWTLTAAALALLAAVLAYWTWAVLAPRPQPAQRTLDTPPAKVAADLFGRGASAVAAESAGHLRLLGVAASNRARAGYAIVRDATRTLVVREGDEVAEGVRIAEVHPTHVVLDRSGRREVLEWPTAPAGPPQLKAPLR